MKYIYNNLVDKLSKAFMYELNAISINYNFDYGDEFEVAICHMLRNFLPLKYGITRGFVITSEGERAGDDIIIYDQDLFPTLRFLVKNDYSRKEEIPIEAVYAYIEAKHKLDKETLKKSVLQIQKVKEMCYKRAVLKDEYIGMLNDGTLIQKGIISNNGKIELFQNTKDGIRPVIRNPIYGMIISRYSVDENNKKTENEQKINEFLMKQFLCNLTTEIKQGGIYNPDFIIAGKSNTVIPAELPHGIQENPLELLPFCTKRKFFQYQINANEEIAYGLGLSHMMIALNLISLKSNDMLWANIFNNSKMLNENMRTLVMNKLTHL